MINETFHKSHRKIRKLILSTILINNINERSFKNLVINNCPTLCPTDYGESKYVQLLTIQNLE